MLIFELIVTRASGRLVFRVKPDCSNTGSLLLICLLSQRNFPPRFFFIYFPAHQSTLIYRNVHKSTICSLRNKFSFSVLLCSNFYFPNLTFELTNCLCSVIFSALNDVNILYRCSRILRFLNVELFRCFCACRLMMFRYKHYTFISWASQCLFLYCLFFL